MSVLTDLIYGGSNAVAGLTEAAVSDAILKYGVCPIHRRTFLKKLLGDNI